MTGTWNLTYSCLWRIELGHWTSVDPAYPIIQTPKPSASVFYFWILSLLPHEITWEWSHVSLAPICRAMKPHPCSPFIQNALILNILHVQIAPHLTHHFLGSSGTWKVWTGTVEKVFRICKQQTDIKQDRLTEIPCFMVIFRDVF